MEGVTARRAAGAEEAGRVLTAGEIPVLADPAAEILHALPFDALVDAILAKRNTGTRITDAPVVLALGPGFAAGTDCHGVVEDHAGPRSGAAAHRGRRHPQYRRAGEIGGYTRERIIRAPARGFSSRWPGSASR